MSRPDGSAMRAWSLALVVGILAIRPAFAAAQTPVGSPAPGFELRDQYDSVFTLGSTHGRVVLLVVGDRHGNQYMGVYTRAVRERFGRDQVVIVRIANLRGVPFFMKGSVRGRFRGANPDGTPRSPVLFDWGGTIARLYGFRSDLTNVYLIDAGGTLRYAAAGQGAAAEVGRLLEAVERTLAESPAEGR
jgi:hypothetical protein